MARCISWCLLSLLTLLQWLLLVEASHFRNGIITFQTEQDSNDTLRFVFRLAFRRSYSGSYYCDANTISQGSLIGYGDSWNAQCRNSYDQLCLNPIHVADTGFRCTDFSVHEDWSMGENNFTVSYSSIGSNHEWIVSYSSCCWISSLARYADSSWLVSTKLDLTPRSDNGKINSSPVSRSPAIFRFHEGCKQSLRIPVEDPDGDVVKCRWASQSESNIPSNSFPYGVLEEKNCVLKYGGASGTAGTYAVTLTLEDFPAGTTNFNNVRPFSSVGLQFLVIISGQSGSCDEKPVFTDSTPQDGECSEVQIGSVYKAVIEVQLADFGKSVAEITTSSPVGMQITPLNYSRGIFYRNVTWNPTQSQFGHQLFCFQALDSSGLQSDWRCVTILVGLSNTPQVILGTQWPIKPISETGQGLIWWRIQFDRVIKKPRTSAYIRLVLQPSSHTVYKVDTRSQYVMIDNNNRTVLQFATPKAALSMNGSYAILIDHGAVVGQGCSYDGPPTPGIASPGDWGFHVDGSCPVGYSLASPKFTDCVDVNECGAHSRSKRWAGWGSSISPSSSYSGASASVPGPCVAVGVADPNKIPDAQMNATSVYLAYYAYEGRLNGSSGWCAGSPNINEYLQVDMGAVRSVCAVATQGKNSGSYVTSYKLSLSTDGVTWNTYMENNVGKVFPGNTDVYTIVKHMLSNSTQARYVRFHPVTWDNWICMRIEISTLTGPTTQPPFATPSPAVDCDFDFDDCGFIQETDDIFDWTRMSGSTSSSYTGPSGDHTSGSGYYMYIETSSPRQRGDNAKLSSPRKQFSGNMCISFYYHMYGGDIERLNVIVNGIIKFTKSWNQGPKWHKAEVTVNLWGMYKVTFEGISGSSYQGDIAIDDFRLYPGSCSSTNSSTSTTNISPTPVLGASASASVPSYLSECSHHSYLDDSVRRMSYYNGYHGYYQCDRNLQFGWYRFRGAAGTQMPTTCVPQNHCSSHAPGWLNNTHPSVADGIVNAKVCFHWSSGCCTWSTDIRVRNCSGFYVYELGPTPACWLRYCGNGGAANASATSVAIPTPVATPTPESCYYSLTDLSGNFTSPNYPQHYPHDQDCTWTITVTPGYFIYLHFAHFQLESGGSHCPYDYMQIFDGNSSSSSLILKRCAYQDSWCVYSNSSVLHVRFITDGSVSHPGFSAYYERVHERRHSNCSTVIYTTPAEPTTVATPTTPGSCFYNLTNLQGHFTSPGFPQSYANNLDCTWIITVTPGYYVYLHFEHFHLEGSHSYCSYDYVQVFDEHYSWNPIIAKRCDFLDPWCVYSKSAVLYVRFKTDSSVSYSGFKAYYGQVNETYSNCSAQSTASPSASASASPPYPSECSHHSFLEDNERGIGFYNQYHYQCDNNLHFGWYRFRGAAGIQMPTACVGKRRCGTHAPGWLDGAHPSVNNSIAHARVCFHWSSSCCYWTKSIRVRNCGGFYVYELGPPPVCHLRYCGNGGANYSTSTTNTSPTPAPTTASASIAPGPASVNGIHPTPSAMHSSLYAASSVNVMPDPAQFKLHLPSDCDQICTNTLGSYTCSCINGYQLAPDGKSCLDINECSSNNGGCSHHCTNIPGSFYCDCPEGITMGANNLTCVEPGVSVDCGDSRMTVSLEKKSFPFFDVAQLRLRYASCKATQNDTHLIIGTDLNGCGTLVNETQDALIFWNEIQADAVIIDFVITRTHDIRLPFYCSYSRKKLLSLSFTPRRIHFGQEVGYGNFTFKIDFYKSSSFATPYDQHDYPLEVQLNDYLFVQYSVESSADLVIMAENCKATKGSFYSWPQYSIIHNGCPRDTTLDYSYDPTRSFQQFKIKTFRFFNDYDTVYFHCELLACKRYSPNSRCSKSCSNGNKRKKRDVTRDEIEHDESTTKTILTQGPVVIKDIGQSGDTGQNKQTALIGGVAGAGAFGLIAVIALAVLFVKYRIARRLMNRNKVGDLYTTDQDEQMSRKNAYIQEDDMIEKEDAL